MLPILIVLAIIASFSVQSFLPSFDDWPLGWELFARSCVQIAVTQLVILLSFIFIIKEPQEK